MVKFPSHRCQRLHSLLGHRERISNFLAVPAAIEKVSRSISIICLLLIFGSMIDHALWVSGVLGCILVQLYHTAAEGDICQCDDVMGCYATASTQVCDAGLRDVPGGLC